MPVPNKKRRQTESRSAPSVWLQQAAGLVCNMGTAPEAWAQGAPPRARCAARVNVNVNRSPQKSQPQHQY